MSKHIVAETSTSKTKNIYKKVPTINAVKIRIYKSSGEKVGTATISARDLEKCKKKVWHMRKNGYVYSGSTALHRYVMNAPSNKDVDHINGNPRNNQRGNLRLVSKKQQAQNRAKAKVDHPINKAVPIAGVYWNGVSWTAEITVNGKKKRKKCDNMIDAVLERIKFEEVYYKSFARNKEPVLKWIQEHDRAKMFGRRN